MQVFVTGATGYIGSAVVHELAAAGHAVTGLVRSAERAALIAAPGVRTVVGDIKKPETYGAEAARHEALIHAAFEYSPAAVEGDRTALATLLAAASAGKAEIVIYTSGIWVLGATGDGPAYEDAPLNPAPLVTWRPPHEKQTLDAASERLATAVIRPGLVYGGRGGLTGSYFESAEREGAATYVGDGTNRVPLIDVEDLARYYRAIVEHRARGAFHGVDGLAIQVLEVARAASAAAGRGGATRSVPLEEARRTLGPVADALVLDQVIASRRGGEVGWKPHRASFPQEAERAYQEWKRARS